MAQYTPVISETAHPTPPHFQRSGVNLARNVGAECFRYLQHSAVSFFLSGSDWGTQLGAHWKNILYRPYGIATLSFVIVLDRRFSSPECLDRVLQEVGNWFMQGGNSVMIFEVNNALIAGNAPGNPIEKNFIAQQQTLGDPQFCQSRIQNSPFAFTTGKLDGLLKPLIKC